MHTLLSKVIVSFLALLGLGSSHLIGGTTNPITPFIYSSANTISPSVSASALKIPSLATSTSNNFVKVDSAGLFSVGAGGGSGSGASSTLLADNNTWSGLNVFNVTTTFGSSIMASGTVGVTPGSGAGTRLMWIPSKAAFRAGLAVGTEMDAANIGQNSLASGQGSIASAADSISMGFFTTANGIRAGAFASGATASATDSLSAGQNCTVFAGATGGVCLGKAGSVYGVSGLSAGYQGVEESVGGSVYGSGFDLLAGGNYSVGIGLNSLYAPASKQSDLANTLIVLGGNTTLGSGTLNSHVLNVSATTTSGGILLLKGIGSQTGDYLSVQDSSANVQAKIDSSGLLTLNSGLLSTASSTFVATTTHNANTVLAGAQFVNRTLINAATYTALYSDYYIAASSTNLAATITLPAASGACGNNKSQVYIVKDRNGSSATNNITVARSGSDTIDGSTSAVISNNYQSLTFISDCSSKWEIQ